MSATTTTSPTPVALPASVTVRDACQVLDAVSGQLQALPAGQAWQVDAAALVQLDTAAIALLLELRRRAEAQGRLLQIVNVPPRLHALATLYGVDALVIDGQPAAA